MTGPQGGVPFNYPPPPDPSADTLPGKVNNNQSVRNYCNNLHLKSIFFHLYSKL